MFKLNIECTKDIDELHINFSDGSSVVTTGGDNSNSNRNKTREETSIKTTPKTNESDQTSRPKSRNGETLDLNTDFGGVSNEVVKPPQIHREEKPVSVAEELQNFDF